MPEIKLQAIGTPDDVGAFMSFLEELEPYLRNYHAAVKGKFYPISGPLYVRKFAEITFHKKPLKSFIEELKLPPDETN